MRAPSIRLVERLRRLGVDIPHRWVFRRTYAGRSQRQAEAWSWWIETPDGREIIGSIYPVGVLLAAPALTVRRSFETLVVDPTGD